MGTRPQLTLLMLTAMLGVINPPSGPPGFRPPKSARMIPCWHKNCRGMGEWQGKYRYDCDERDHSFYYCYKCEKYLTPEEATKH